MKPMWKENSFKSLLILFPMNLKTCKERVECSGSKIDVLEVFCGPQSQLTHQCQQLGYRAVRFGLAEGDLQTEEGRNRLFQVLIKHRPKHVWFSQNVVHGVVGQILTEVGLSNHGMLFNKAGYNTLIRLHWELYS